MLVVVMMNKARDPRMYDWMGFDRQGPPRSDQAATPRAPDTRIPVERESGRQEVPGTVSGATPREAPWHQSPGEPSVDRLEQAKSLAWSQLWPLLRRADRDALHQWLQGVQAGNLLSPDSRTRLATVIEQLDRHWSKFLKDQRAQLVSDNAQLDEAQRHAWRTVLEQLESGWTQDSRLALQQIRQGQPPGVQQQRTLLEIQNRIGRFALTKVRDNTLHRGPEQEAWFHLFEILQQTPEPVLYQRSTGTTSYLQLFQQPSEYRARIVTLRGSARMISRFWAPRNIYGIEDYFRIVLKPQGGPDNPILIYALEMPADFPVPQKPQTHQKVREEIECAGYFFKRLVFRSGDGLRTAPLVLARLPRWHPAPTETSEAMPGLLWLSTGALVCLLTAIAIAWTAYRQTQYLPASETRPATSEPRLSIADEDLVPSPEETLRRLAQSDAKPE